MEDKMKIIRKLYKINNLLEPIYDIIYFLVRIIISSAVVIVFEMRNGEGSFSGFLRICFLIYIFQPIISKYINKFYWMFFNEDILNSKRKKNKNV